MLLSSILLAGSASQMPAPPQPTPANIPDVVAAAVNCFEATATKDVAVSRLTDAGWAELLNSNGTPETPGGHAFRHPGVSAEIAVVGSVCSLVAPVKSFDEIKTVLMQLDDAIHPDKIEERNEGILLEKSGRSILFFTGDPTVQKPFAVRIDTEFSEKQ